MPTKSQCCGIFGYVVAVILIAGGACLYELLPPFVHKMIKDELPVTHPGSSGFDTFANSSGKVSIYQSFYLFHVENPYDVVYNGAAPILQERGPYNYLTTQWRNLDNISWYANATLAYTYHETYTFEPGLSNGLLDTDMITTLDLGVIGAMYENRNDPILVDLIKLLAANYNVFANLTVKEMLFGYNNTFLASMGHNPFVTIFTNDDPSSWSAPTALYTGGSAASTLPAPPANSMNFLTQWEGYSTLPYWGDNYANMINGTDGTVLSPGITSSDRPYVFVDTLYRSCTLMCQETVTYQGVDLLRFVLAPEMLLNMSANPNNAAFGMIESGFLPTPPAGNAPITFSKPHYLDANTDRVLVKINSVGDVTDPRAAYETILDTEPNTGILMQVHKRIQMNAFIQSNYSTGESPALLATWFPVLWADENMALPTNLVDQFKHEVQLPLLLAKWGGIAAISLGGALFVLVSIVLIARRRSGDSAASHLNSYSNLSTDQQLNAEAAYGGYR
ncbi:integral membrane protein, putative [Bodo saltans]|uniref:Integral membrane protein, putative n=1 Tax=Bodo saltans TaxID=75058 RepID=A0A0S4JFF3_BODSA|nr:integral membrane protein, putative [Bodo saltans]|eukprot:CUG88165.1 integral membrane protein, putative [Bodo saltans]